MSDYMPSDHCLFTLVWLESAARMLNKHVTPLNLNLMKKGSENSSVVCDGPVWAYVCDADSETQRQYVWESRQVWRWQKPALVTHSSQKCVVHFSLWQPTLMNHSKATAMITEFHNNPLPNLMTVCILSLRQLCTLLRKWSNPSKHLEGQVHFIVFA